MLGISEHRASFHNSLGSIGKQDNEGNTIAICYVNGAALRIIPLVLRVIVFLLLLAVILYRQPLSGLPDLFNAPSWYVRLRTWEIFSVWQWAAALGIYLLYFGFTLVKNGLYRGVPGAEIHFTRYGKIVETVRPGEGKLIIDPRVGPWAVVSTKLMTVPMPEIENNTRDNITLRFRGTIVLQVTDTLRLLQAGGFEKFLRQLRELYTSCMRDAIQRVNARTFNQFFIEKVQVPAGKLSTNITDRLSRLANTQLSVETLEELSEIDELDVSGLGLEESQNPDRRSILPRLQQLGNDYGVRIFDHIPNGNRTTDEYLQTLALSLVSSIARLNQASKMLYDIRKGEIEVDISNHVASRQMLALEIRKVLQSIRSVTKTLGSSESRDKLTTAQGLAMDNRGKAILTVYTSRIDALLTRTRASGASLASNQLLVSTYEEVLTTLAKLVNHDLPTVGTVVTERVDEATVVPDVDVIEALFKKSGLTEALDELEQNAGSGFELEKLSEALEAELQGIDTATIIAEIERALDKITAQTGVSTGHYTPEKVEAIIVELEKKMASEQQAAQPATA